MKAEMSVLFHTKNAKIQKDKEGDFYYAVIFVFFYPLYEIKKLLLFRNPRNENDNSFMQRRGELI